MKLGGSGGPFGGGWPMTAPEGGSSPHWRSEARTISASSARTSLELTGPPGRCSRMRADRVRQRAIARARPLPRGAPSALITADLLGEVAPAGPRRLVGQGVTVVSWTTRNRTPDRGASSQPHRSGSIRSRRHKARNSPWPRVASVPRTGSPSLEMLQNRLDAAAVGALLGMDGERAWHDKLVSPVRPGSGPAGRFDRALSGDRACNTLAVLSPFRYRANK